MKKLPSNVMKFGSWMQEPSENQVCRAERRPVFAEKIFS
jgi:hypothetical protein